jgi:hypothetical protein
MMDHHDLDIHSCPDGVTLTIAWGGRKVTGKVGMRACEQAVSGVNGAGPGVNGVEGIVNEMPISSIRPGDQFCEFNGASATVRLFRLLSVNHSTSETTWTATHGPTSATAVSARGRGRLGPVHRLVAVERHRRPQPARMAAGARWRAGCERSMTSSSRLRRSRSTTGRGRLRRRASSDRRLTGRLRTSQSCRSRVRDTGDPAG